MEAYSLNPQLIPGKPLSHDEHKKVMTILIIILAVAAALSLWYLWVVPHKEASPANVQPDLRLQVANLLKQAPVHASQAEIDQVTALLSRSKAAPTSAEQQSVADLLKK